MMMISRMLFTKPFLIFVIATAWAISAQAWDVDFSRRNNKSAPVEESGGRYPAAVPASNEGSPSNNSSYTLESAQKAEVNRDKRLDTLELVILNTPRGFVPKQIRLRKGLHYTAHVVNVNEDKKNVSFILDGFAQHHATYFGKIKTFYVDPQQEGVYEFICPETSAKGEFVIFGGNSPAPVVRTPAAE
jgi:hypothetical protein